MFKNRIINNIGLLIGGTAIAQGITFVGMLYLTDIYDPESFGLVSLCTSIVSLLIPIATLRYDKAIILESDETEIKRLVLICIYICVAFFLFLSLLGVVIYLLNIISKSHYNIILLVVPLGVLFFGFINTFQMYFEKKEKFRITSKVSIIDATSRISFQIALKNFFPITGMLFGYVFSLFLNVVYYSIKFKNKLTQTFFIQPKKELIFLCKKHKNFPRYFTWSNIIDSASQNICALSFPFLFSLSVLGNFSLAYKIVRLPALLFSIATRRVYYPKANQLFNQNIGEFKFFYKKGTVILFLISIFPVLCFQFFADDFFEFFFEPKWAISSKYAKIIIWYVFFNFCNSLAHENIIIFGLQKFLFIIELGWFVLSAVLIYVGFYLKDASLAILFYVLSGILMETALFILSFKKIKNLKSIL